MPDSLCIVCSREVTENWVANCNNCGGLYHFRQREDMTGDDCGEAWLDPEHLALEFACNTCLAPPPPTESLNEIVTAGEAALIASMSETSIVALAEGGQLPHRNAGGVYLFQRADIEALAGQRG